MPSAASPEPGIERLRPKAIFLLFEGALKAIYGDATMSEVTRLVDLVGPPQTGETILHNLDLLKEVEVIFSGWGAPVMDADFLAAAPKLKVVFYGAGSIRNFVTEAFWDRKIIVTSAYESNSLPVAEYTLATILLSLKHFWRYTALSKSAQGWSLSPDLVPGCFQSTVGLISIGMIARRTLKLLEPFELKRLVYSTSLPDSEARLLNVTKVSLEDIFRESDVVSLHTPDLPSTRSMIRGEHFEMMKPGATFLNTARGAVVNEAEMIEVLRRRTDLTAVLDVTWPEPPAPDSPLYSLPNVVLTPHIAGSIGRECRRLGHSMLEELRNYLQGKPLRGEITRATANKLA